MPDRFIASVSKAGGIPQDFANIEYVLEGMAITDAAIDYWLNDAFFGLASNPMVAMDTRLLSFIGSRWYERIDSDFTILQLLATTAPNSRIGSAIAYGHDYFIRIYEMYLSGIDTAFTRAQSAGVDGYVAIPVLDFFRILEVYVGLRQLRYDATESVKVGSLIGSVEAFSQDVAGLSKKNDGISTGAAVALAFAGLGAVGMFAIIMAGGVK
jgi:hypothetical protein